MRLRLKLREPNDMSTYSITEAKARLGALVEQVARGEPVILTKRGKPVARIISFSAPIAELPAKPKFDLARLRAFRATQKRSKVNAAVMIRKMRGEEPGW